MLTTYTTPKAATGPCGNVSEDVYVCEHCRWPFSSMTALRRHRRRAMPPPEDPGRVVWACMYPLTIQQRDRNDPTKWRQAWKLVGGVWTRCR